MNIKMRRFRQMLPPDETMNILATASSGVLALCGNEEYPYAVPVSFAYDGKDIYIHSAVAGHKIDCIRANSKVSFCIISQDEVMAQEFTTYYKSVVVFGTATLLAERADIIYGLRLLAGKYSPGIDSREEIEKSLSRVAVIRISVDDISGKEAIELTRKRQCNQK